MKDGSLLTGDFKLGHIPAGAIASVATQRGINVGNCDADHQQARVSLTQVDQTNAPSLVDHGFYVWLEK